MQYYALWGCDNVQFPPVVEFRFGFVRSVDLTWVTFWGPWTEELYRFVHNSDWEVEEDDDAAHERDKSFVSDADIYIYEDGVDDQSGGGGKKIK